MYNEFEEEIYDTVFDALLDFINCLPKETVKMIDFERYTNMMQAAAELKDILTDTNSQGNFDIELLDLFNAGSIKVELDDLTVLNTVKFSSMIEKADNFEIYPRTDGKLQLNITFQSILNTIG